MDADEVEASDEKRYHTRFEAGGRWLYLWSVVWALVLGAVLMLPGMRRGGGDVGVGNLRNRLVLTAIEVMIPVLLALGAIVYLREHDLKTILSDTGVTIRNRLGQRRFIPWHNVVGMVWTGPPGEMLSLEVLSERGKRRRRIIANEYPATSAVVGELREAILSRLGLTERPEARKHTFSFGWRTEQRVWR